MVFARKTYKYVIISDLTSKWNSIEAYLPN